MVRGHLRPLVRCTLAALVVLDVHNREVIATLVENKIESEFDF